MRKLLLLLLAVALLSAAFFFFRAPPAPGTAGLFPQASITSPPVSAGQNLPPPAAPKPAEAAPAFVDFMRSEAKSLDTVGIDPEAAERRAQSAASGMGPKEFQFARDVALSAASASGEKIMAVFLLSAAGEAGWPALRDILRAPLSRERVEPHTEGEYKSMQEKALRLMAVDALAEEAVTSERARAELRSWLAATPDPALARTIQKKLDGLPPL